MDVSGQNHARPFCLRDGTPVLNELEADWAPEPIGRFGEEEKSLNPAGIWTPGHKQGHLQGICSEKREMSIL